MELLEITAKEYEELCDGCKYFYNSGAFHKLNREKAEQVVYFYLKEEKTNWHL